VVFAGIAVLALGGLVLVLVLGRFGPGRGRVTAAPAAAATLQPAPGQAATPAGSGPAPSQPAASGPAGPAQAIVSFGAPASERCPAGAALSFVSVSWTTANATAVSLSVDGPARFADGPPNGSTVLPFACANAQHSYTLTTSGPSGPPATRTVVVRRG